jgi:hypothetical protein
MASELKFGSPEWRVKYMKTKARRSTPILPKGATEHRASLHARDLHREAQGPGDAEPFLGGIGRRLGNLKTWQIALLAAGGALGLQHLLAPKGTSIVSKILGGSAGGHRVGAVNRGGFKGGAGMPFGPGPWPTQNAAAPAENGQGASRPTIMTNENGELQMTGWGHGEMPVPYGREHYGYSYTPWWV